LYLHHDIPTTRIYVEHSIAARHRLNYPFNCILSPYFVFKNENVKVKVKYSFVLYTGLSFAMYIAQIGNQNKGVRDFWNFA
jgi:hypothetical protein